MTHILVMMNFLVNNVLNEYDNMKEDFKILKTLEQFITDFCLFIKQYYIVVWNVEKMQKVKTQGFYLKVKNEWSIKHVLICRR